MDLDKSAIFCAWRSFETTTQNGAILFRWQL